MSEDLMPPQWFGTYLPRCYAHCDMRWRAGTETDLCWGCGALVGPANGNPYLLLTATSSVVA